jgi:hypothetical protein
MLPATQPRRATLGNHAVHAASLNPAHATAVPTANGRFTKLPLLANSAMASSSVSVASLPHPERAVLAAGGIE